MVQGDDGVQGELAVVHALGDDHFVVAVGGLRADPGNVPVLGLIGGRDGRGGLEENLLAVFVFLVPGQGLKEAAQGQGLAVGHREAERAFGHGVLHRLWR